MSNLSIDLAWLLMIAEQKTPGDPQVTDWGALVAAVARHEAEIFDVPVYDTPHARANRRSECSGSIATTSETAPG